MMKNVLMAIARVLVLRRFSPTSQVMSERGSR
jgi:hypothetical protein